MGQGFINRGFTDEHLPPWVQRLGYPSDGDISIDEFNGQSLDAAWTTLIVTGGQTIAVKNGLLSVQPTSSITVTDTNCILQPYSIATGEAVEVAVIGLTEDDARDPLWGPVITDGTTATDTMAWCAMQHFTNQVTHIYPSGTNATLTANGIAGTSKGQNMFGGPLYLRIEYDAANSFKSSWSKDKVIWHDGYTMSATMTPSQVGFGWNTASLTAIAESFAIEYVRIVTV